LGDRRQRRERRPPFHKGVIRFANAGRDLNHVVHEVEPDKTVRLSPPRFPAQIVEEVRFAVGENERGVMNSKLHDKHPLVEMERAACAQTPNG